ncbi:MAG: 6-bladed beta-propeller [Candidatus Aminicenantales bacterium]
MKMNQAGIFVVCLGIVAGLTPAAASAQVKWKGMIVKEGDVTVVKNPKEPIYKIPPLELREDFVLGGEGSEGKYVLSHPFDMAVNAMEDLYVVDAGERNLKVFDKNGQYVKTIGRPGQGPGEFQFPRGICIIPGTAEIVVVDLQSISTFNPAGGYLRRSPVRGLSAGIRADGQGNLFIETSEIRSGKVILQTYASGMGGEPALVLSYQEDQSYVVFRPRAQWILNQKGQIVFGESKTYEIKIVDSEGHILTRILRDYDPVRVTQEEKNDLAKRTKEVLGPEAAKSMEFASHHSAYRSFFPADGGRLFVQTWERSADGRQDIYDIFDEEGRYIARTPLNLNPDFLNPRTRLIKNGKLYTIEPDPKGYEVVKRYSVKWNIPDK